jgi:integrase
VAWIQILGRQDGGKSYKVLWRDPGRRVRSKTFRRRSDAQRWARSVEVRKDEGTYIDPKAGRLTFGDFFEHYLTTATHLKPSSRSLYEKHGARYLLPALGSRPLNSIKQTDVKALLGNLSRRLGPPTVRSVYRLLRRVLNVAVEEDRIARNPAARIRLPAEERHVARFLTPDEIAALVQETPGRYRTLFLLLAYGGLRIGEAAALRVGDLDLMRGRVQVRRNSVEVDGTLVEGTPKGGRERTVRIPRFLADALADHLARFGEPRAPESRVFTGEAGAPLRQSRVRSRVFAPACRQAGLEPAPRLHDLRHTAVALAIAAGAHPRVVQEMAGHASIAMTLNTYGSLFPSLQDQVADRLEEAYRAAAPQEASVLPLP